MMQQIKRLRLIMVVCLMMSTYSSLFSQVIDGKQYNYTGNWYNWQGGRFVTNLNVPKVQATNGRDTGAIYYKIADSSLYVWTGSQWRQVAGGGGGATDTTSLSNRINLKLNISDTASMLSPYLRSNVAAATYQPIGSYATTSQVTVVQSNLDTTRTGIRADLNGKQGALTLTTTGSSGAATLVGNTLNIPQYSGGGGSAVTSFGIDSIGENFYGTIYDSTTWNNLSSFTNNGGTFTVTSNKIVGSSGAGTFTQSLDLNYFTLLERWKIAVKVKATSGANGFGIGIRSAETGTKVNVIGRFDGNSGTAIINAGGSNTQVAATSAVSFSTNDYIILTFERDKDIFTVTARNATTNSATQSTTYTFLTSDATVQLPNTGKFAVFSFGGNFEVDSLAITSKEVKNAKIMTIGDSKTQAYYASTWSNRYSEKLGTKFKSTIVSAGGFDRTDDVINRLPEIYALNPKQIILAIGSNDIRAGVSAATIYANYDTIVARIERNLPNTEVFHALPFYESGGLDQTGLKAHIESTYPSSKIFDTYNPMRRPSTLNADGIHPNDLGNTYIYDAIVEKMKLIGADNVGGAGSSTTLASGSIPFSNGSTLTEDNTNFRYNSASTLFGVGGTPTARAHFFTTNDAAPATLTSFTNKHLVVGPSGSGLALSYSTTNNRAYISAVSPGTAWRSLGMQGDDLNFYYQGAATPVWRMNGLTGAVTSTTSSSTPVRNEYINTNTGASTYAEVAIGQSSTATDQLRLVTLSSGFSTSANYVQDGASIEAGATLSGGLSISSSNASGVIRFYTGGTSERARLDASGNLLLGTTSTTASAKLVIESTTQGFLPPRMTATQASAISSPAEGLLVYVTDTNGTFTSKGWWGYNGTTWEKLNN